MGKKPSAVNASSGDEELHAAARSGDLKAVQAICSANPLAVNSRDRHSRTPLDNLSDELRKIYERNEKAITETIIAHLSDLRSS